jgi:hypothetical protein
MMIQHEPDMNIVNQINAGLNDVRSCFVRAVNNKPQSSHEYLKARYIINEISLMIEGHFRGENIPWSQRKGAVEEEFSD